MSMSRRDFLKGAGTGAAVAAAVGVDTAPVEGAARELKTKGAREVPSLCYYCAVGCGIVASVADGKVVAIQGDPEHPINRGALCSKAQAYIKVLDHPNRLTKALYRPPGATEWQEKPLDWAMDRIAELTKQTRDANFNEFQDMPDGKGGMVKKRDQIPADVLGQMRGHQKDARERLKKAKTEKKR